MRAPSYRWPCYGSFDPESVKLGCDNCIDAKPCKEDSVVSPGPVDEQLRKMIDNEGPGRIVISPNTLLLNPELMARTPDKSTSDACTANDRQVAGTHYKDMDIEPWDVIDTWPLEQRIGAYRAGVLKYTMRMGSKDARLQEIKKGGHYNEKLAEVLAEAAAAADETRFDAGDMAEDVRAYRRGKREGLQAALDALLVSPSREVFGVRLQELLGEVRQ